MNIYCIIINYNGLKWINHCIQSLNKSSVKNHIIIVDNGSSDDSLDFIKTNYPDIKLIENKINLGFGKANNYGFKIALNENADFIMTINQDVYVETIR